MLVKRTNEVSLKYDSYGQGEPLVFLHGAMVSRNYWQPQIDHFSSRYRVITCDLRGHGETTATDDPYSVAMFARDVVATLDRLDLDHVICCGHSLGGMVAQELALSHPDRVRGLILAETWHNPRGEIWELFPFRTVMLKWLLLVNRTDALIEMMVAGLGAFNPAIREQIRTMMSQHTQDRDNFLKIWDAAIDFHSTRRLDQITCPTLILVSENFMMTQAQSLGMRRRISGAELNVIPGSGHLLNLDNAAAFNSAVEQFLQQRCQLLEVESV